MIKVSVLSKKKMFFPVKMMLVVFFDSINRNIP